MPVCIRVGSQAPGREKQVELEKNEARLECHLLRHLLHKIGLAREKQIELEQAEVGMSPVAVSLAPDVVCGDVWLDGSPIWALLVIGVRGAVQGDEFVHCVHSHAGAANVGWET